MRAGWGHVQGSRPWRRRRRCPPPRQRPRRAAAASRRMACRAAAGGAPRKPAARGGRSVGRARFKFGVPGVCACSRCVGGANGSDERVGKCLVGKGQWPVKYHSVQSSPADSVQATSAGRRLFRYQGHCICRAWMADLDCSDGLHEALLAASTQPGRMSPQLIISQWRRERSMFARR